MMLTDEQIRAELRELRERPSEEFAAELDAWAAEGFPAASDPRRQGEPAEAPFAERGARSLLGRLGSGYRRLRARPPLGALAGAGAVILVAGVALSVYTATERQGVEQRGGGDDGLSGIVEESDRPAESGGSDGGPALRDSGPIDVEPAPSTAPPSLPDEQLKPGKKRVQERSASMTLSADPDRVAEVADGVIEVTERYDGIVVSSTVSTNEEVGRASFDLRIPTANLRAALADLSDLASVASREEGTLDITAPFVTAEERFQDAKGEVDALLERLADAGSSSEVASIREQLRIARGELVSARADLGALKQRADFSRLSLTVVGEGDADGWSLGDAADDALSVLEDLAGAGLVALAVIVPLGALAIGTWLGLSALRRRRRERALDH